jgi:hypothetical protein
LTTAVLISSPAAADIAPDGGAGAGAISADAGSPPGAAGGSASTGQKANQISDGLAEGGCSTVGDLSGLSMLSGALLLARRRRTQLPC